VVPIGRRVSVRAVLMEPEGNPGDQMGPEASDGAKKLVLSTRMRVFGGTHPTVPTLRRQSALAWRMQPRIEREALLHLHVIGSGGRRSNE
jgi:hypothetical protein